MRGEHGHGVPIASVFAMTGDFEAEVIRSRNDQDLVPAKLRARDTPEATVLAAAAAHARPAMSPDGVDQCRVRRPPLD